MKSSKKVTNSKRRKSVSKKNNKSLLFSFLLLALVATFVLAGVHYYRGQAQHNVAGVGTGSFLDTFSGNPDKPTIFTSPNWDMVTNVSDSWLGGANWDKYAKPVHAHHGADCSAPLATHEVNDIYNSVFDCRDHMMTTIDGGGYGAVYLTPNQKVNFDDGEAVVSFDVSTFKASGRQWWDLWIQPFQNNFQLPLENWLPAYNGKPKQAVSIKMEGETFNGFYVNDFQQIDIPKTADGWKSVAQVLSENGLQPSASRRDKFELRISKNHIKFGMPQYNHWWIDTDIPDRGWTEGTVTIGHHEYNSSKDCTPNPPDSCVPTTFHWDNFAINPAVPFTIIRGKERGINATTGSTVTFPSPAPANAYLKFSAVGTIQASFNGGTYKTISKLQHEKDQPEHFSNYFTPIPAGTTTVSFKGSPDRYISQWMVRDPSIYAESARIGGASPTSPASVTSTTAPTKTPVPDEPTPTKIPIKTPTPISGDTSVDFNSKNSGTLSGSYPANLINWGSNQWYVSEPWKKFTTNSVSFNGGSRKSAYFDLASQKIFKGIDAYADTASTVTIKCGTLPKKTIKLAAKSLTTISTGWTQACTRIIVGSTNSWDTNFDNFVITSE